MKKIKLSYLKILQLQEHIHGKNIAGSTIPGFKSKQTAIGWPVLRSSVFIDSASKQYYEQLNNLIDLFCEKDENGKRKIREGTPGVNITDFTYTDIGEFSKNLNDLYNTEIEVEICEASKEKLTEYINTNPAPVDYEIFIGNVINPEFVP